MNHRHISSNRNTVHFKQWSNKKYAVFNSLGKQIKICALVVSYSILIFANHVSAQTDTSTASRIIELEEVDIVATLLDQGLNDAGRSVTMITHNDIHSSPARSIDELIKYSPCIETQSRNLFGIQSDFSIRGSTFNQTLILIDGMRLNDPLTGHFSSNIPVPMAEVERIEIIRGPAASIYGPDAVGGVINIITRAFSSSRPEKNITSSGSVLFGENNLFSTNAGLYIKENKLSASAGFMANTSDGEKLPTGIHNYFDSKRASVSAAWQFNPRWSAALRTAYEMNDFSAQNFYTPWPTDTSTEKITRSWNQLQITRISDNSSTQFSIGYSQTKDTFLFYPGLVPNAHKTGYYNSFLKHTFNIHPKLKIVFGEQLDHRAIISNDRGNHADWHTGLFANATIKPIKNLTLLTGIRGDYDDNFGFEVLPQFTVSYQFNPLTIRGSIGRSIRAADYTERYIHTHLEYVRPEFDLGNPNLKAEKAWSHELGFDYIPFNGTKLSVSSFYRNSRHLIDYVFTHASEITNNHNLDSGAVYSYAKNMAELSTFGVETDMSLHKILGNHQHLRLIVGYTYTNSLHNDSVISKYISSHAINLLTGTFSYKNKLLAITLTAQIKQRETQLFEYIGVKHSSVTNIWNARLDVNLYRSIIFANLQVKNLFDETYYEVLGAKMPGRWIMAGMVWEY